MKSVFNGTDRQLIPQLLDFYKHPEGKMVDLTANTRKMWKGIDTSNITFCDINPEVKPDIICDYKQTPFADNSIPVIFFDPPHLPLASASDKSMKSFVNMYGLKESVKGDNIDEIFLPFLTEANRVLKQDGLIFIKIIDFVHNHKKQWTLVSFINEARKIPTLTVCDMVIKCDPSAGKLMSSKWKNSHHVRNSHCYWVVVRKGKCESALK